MYSWLYALAKKFWPALEHANEQRRLVGVGDVVTFLLATPLALAGLGWLWATTDWIVLREHGMMLLLYLGLIFIFNRTSYFIIVEIRKDRYGSADGSLTSMLQWSAVFTYGPSALWLAVISTIINSGINWRSAATTAGRWSALRSLAIELATNTLAYLGAVKVYVWSGGSFPITNLYFPVLMQALLALVVHFILVLLLWSVYIGYSIWIQRKLSQSAPVLPLARFLLLALGLPVLAHPYAILLAGLYQIYGLPIFIFLLTGLFFVAYLARRLSWAAETSRQQSRQLEKLEHLSRDIINAPPDASKLPELLQEHVPMMFSSSRIAIWLRDRGVYLLHPADWELQVDLMDEWVRLHPETHSFQVRQPLPWLDRTDLHEPVVVSPIQDVEHAEVIGCIYMELRSLAQPWDNRALGNLFPAVQTLAAQIASALHQALVYEDSLQYHSTLQELEFAGRLQAGFLPRDLPRFDGWELAMTLLPARETSGDYFDIMPLSDGKIGILIADVADKGLGAALYMALSRTLIRTYALEYGMAPDIVFYSVNERILQDASTNLFVTAFYGILDPENGVLTYANAGHNPPFLFSANGGTINALAPTGMAIGIESEAVWSQNAIQILPGDTLLMYTDGIPDAENSQGVMFRERSLIEAVQTNLGKPAEEIQKGILTQLEQFVGDTAQFDDITLLVIRRDDSPDSGLNSSRGEEGGGVS